MKKFIILIFVVFFALNLDAKRLVVLDPAIVEMLYMLQAQDEIVAIAQPTTSAIWPENLTKNLPSVGTYTKPNLEKIIELKPDLVIASFHSINTISELKKFDINATIYEANSLENIYSNLEQIGKIVEKSHKANEIIASLKNSLNSATNHDKLQGKKIAILFSVNPIMAFNDQTLPGDIASKLGLKNIVTDTKAKSPILPIETLLVANPDFIIVIGDNEQKNSLIKSYPALKSIKAAKNGKIISIPSSLILRGTPRIAEGIEILLKEMR
ncbi:MAG: helical backbone metal receptor [Campylobacter lanienae]|uniref:ABC transporter substrate-binding protein n=1 Tax=Campylobacter lanienae TaxID=75658 RepID=UPI002430DEED|nr:helical backbone metal receptor [Campylobacter lanienae]MDD7514130.1 helical backbone metal receptor [Campylobacter lanienae]MDY6057527.1 helical backbone metal receptor [Campylobacter lanienae]